MQRPRGGSKLCVFERQRQDWWSWNLSEEHSMRWGQKSRQGLQRAGSCRPQRGMDFLFQGVPRLLQTCMFQISLGRHSGVLEKLWVWELNRPWFEPPLYLLPSMSLSKSFIFLSSDSSYKIGLMLSMWFIHSFVHSPHKYLLHFYCVLGPGEVSIRRIDEVFLPSWSLWSTWRWQSINKQYEWDNFR